MTLVQFTQDIAISALQGRFSAGQQVEVPDDLVDMLVSGGFVVVVNSEDTTSLADDTAPTPRRKTKATNE